MRESLAPVVSVGPVRFALGGIVAARRDRDRDPAWLSETNRVEAFSDGVFAIVITLLVIDVRSPATQSGRLLHDLLAQWPAYLAYLT